MHSNYPHKRVLVELVGEEAVRDLIEKHGEDAVPAVFALMIESENWTAKDAYDFTMEHFQGVFEERSDYLAALYFEHLEKALTSYTEKHLVTWPLSIDEMTNAFDWDAVAERTAGHDYFAYQTFFEDESKQYFIFKTALPSTDQE
jgi:hypothetical protein